MNLICGINPVLEALNAGHRHFDRLMIVKGIRNQRVSEAIARATRRGIPLRFEARETLDRWANGVPHQGIIAVVSAKPVSTLDEILTAPREPALLVVLDGVEDPRNLGAILRTAEAAGADAVLLPDRHSAGLSETVSRASAGAIEYVRVARIGNTVQAIETLKARGFWVVGFDAAGSDRWDAVDYRRPVALVFGGEGRGIRRLVRERCDHLVSLPLFGHVTSLNVSVAAGVALYEVIRQRGSAPSHVRPIPLKAAAAEHSIMGPGPDDSELDPGHLQPVGAAAEPGGGDDDESPVRVDLEEEEAAWAGRAASADVPERRRPSAVAAAARNQDTGRREGRSSPPPGARPGRRRRRRGPRPPAPGLRASEGAASSAAAPTASVPGAALPGDGNAARKRRRRRRRRH